MGLLGALIAVSGFASASMFGFYVMPEGTQGRFQLVASKPADVTASAGATVFARVRDSNGNVVSAKRLPTSGGTLGSMATAGFQVDLSDLKPGIYALSLSVPRGFFQTSDGRSRSDTGESDPVRFYVSLPKISPSLPSIGQKYVYFPVADDLYVPHQGDANFEQSGPSLKVRELTLSSVKPADGGKAWTFAEGTRRLRFHTNGSTWLPFKRVVEDDELRRLRAAYEGRKIWHYGGTWAACWWSEPGNATKIGLAAGTIRITRILRLYGAPYSLPLSAMPAATASSFNDREGGFFTWTPLVAVFDIHPSLPAASGSRCKGPFYAMFADRWDFEHAFSLKPPTRGVREITRGMTKEEVLWSIGFPLFYGSRADLLALDTWKYEHLLPFHYWCISSTVKL